MVYYKEQTIDEFKNIIDEVLENQKCLGILSFLEDNKELRMFFNEYIDDVI